MLKWLAAFENIMQSKPTEPLKANMFWKKDNKKWVERHITLQNGIIDLVERKERGFFHLLNVQLEDDAESLNFSLISADGNILILCAPDKETKEKWLCILLKEIVTTNKLFSEGKVSEIDDLHCINISHSVQESFIEERKMKEELEIRKKESLWTKLPKKKNSSYLLMEVE